MLAVSELLCSPDSSVARDSAIVVGLSASSASPGGLEYPAVWESVAESGPGARLGFRYLAESFAFFTSFNCRYSEA